MEPMKFLGSLFHAAVDAASPAKCLPPNLPSPPRGRTVVVGAGKAAASMARAVEDHWRGPLSGVVVTRYGHGVACAQIEVIEAAHPVPDAAGLKAARSVLDAVGNLNEDDLVLGLFSGGGSSLLVLPAEGIRLQEKQAVSKALLRSGADIGEMNCVRKQLSAIKGGQLAHACFPAPIVNLLISDVPGDDPSVIASGPTVPDQTRPADALAVLRKYGISEPAAVINHLQSRARANAGHERDMDTRIGTRLIAVPQDALLAAADAADRAGVAPHILGDLEGEARDVALVHAGMVRQIVRHGQPFRRPCVLLSGGETTVTVRGSGRGGRNLEFLLSLAVALDGLPGVYAIACDTDGIDGTEDNAGALLAPDALDVAAAQGIDGREALQRNDGYGFFSAIESLVTTGPTRTNVNDFRAILIS